jgi:PAS domain S-box-containing protein
MAATDDEGDRLRAAALRNADAIQLARRRAERELAAERERLRATLAGIGDAVISTDAAGRVTFLNGVAEALTGWPAAEAAGRPLPEVFHIVNEYTRQPVENPALRALREGVVVGLANHTVLIARDGTERPIDDSAAPMRDEAGRPIGAVLVFRDVTERKRAEEARARLAAIVESSDDAIVSKTLDGVIRSWNGGAERLFGWTAAEAVGRPITLIIPPDRLDEERDILARLGRGERIDHYETVRVARDGRRLDVSISVSPVRDAAGRVVGASKVGRDITDRKRAEEGRRFLAEAGEVLGSSLDYEATLAGVARLVVPRLADWCSVYVAEPDGRLRQLAVAHADPAKVAWARDLAARYPPDPDAPRGVPAVVRSGEPEFAPELTDEMVAGFARDPDHLAALRALGPRSVMIVPLAARDRTVGAITFVAAESGRRYAEADLALALDLGRRAGLAVDNARLFRESQESLRLLGLLVEASGRLTGSLDPHAVGAAILDLSHRLVAADAYAIWRLSPDGAEWAIAESAGLSAGYLRAEGRIPAAGRATPDRPIVAEDARGSARLESRRRAYEAEGIASLLAVPLKSHGRVAGTLVFYYRTRRRFDEVTVRVASALADLAGAAVGTAELYARETASRRRAEEADRQKGEFLAMLAHELRNPLAPIKNALHILRLRGDDPAAAAKAREVMDRQVTHLARLVDDLLDVTRVSTGKVRLRAERLDLAGVARQAAADHRAAYEAKGVSLAVRAPDGPVWVSGDPTRLAQIADNLLTNARKFTPAGGEVVVTVGEGAGGGAALAVRDTGAGIDPDMLGRLFEPFAQADRTLDRTAGGLGLGLAIVKGLAALHGGTVRAESEGLGRGATFTVTLPTLAGPEAPDPGPPAEDRPARRLRVLLVEDHRDAADSLRLVLEASGHRVEVAYTGPDGVRAAAASRPEVVICDIGLPGLDGYAVARALRRHPATAAARLIALTGYGTDDDRRRAEEAGFDDHLIKPADPAALEALLARSG